MTPEKEYPVTAGQEFGELRVLDLGVRTAPTRSRPNGCRGALCQCSCGRQKVISLSHLTTGFVRSCGCGQGNLKHGLARRESRHPLYMTWALMMDRCHNPDSKDYTKWGGRGITVCPEWHNAAIFISWVEANIGPRPGGLTAGGRPEYTIDRKNNDLGYAPGNVRWADNRKQARNTQRSIMREQRIHEAQVMRSNGLSQGEIADALGVGLTTVSGYLPTRLNRSGRFAGTTVAERAQVAAGLQAAGRTLTEIAAITGVHTWTVRRYLNPDRPAGVIGEPAPPCRTAKAVRRAELTQASRELRATGKTQGEIAAILGISQGSVSNYLRIPDNHEIF